MAVGLFDLSLKTVYKSLVPYFNYSPTCEPNNFSIGLKVEEYLKAEYRVNPSAKNTIQPVFFDCMNCPCREYEDSLSRLNPRQADLIAEFLVKMMWKLKLSPEDIVVLTPYRANIGALGRRFRREQVLESVEFTSFNLFQGREAQIVVLALCVNAQTGPLTVAEQRSLNVALTRQKSSLLIFGDINTPAYQEHRSFENFGTNWEWRINQRVFNEVFHMIRANGRIVTIEGKEMVDPDNRWKPRDQKRSGRGRRGR
jgi:superfamily I DNA and/or RNA helicase